MLLVDLKGEGEEGCVPFILDDFPEAVYHAIVCLVADALARLELPVMSQMLLGVLCG